MTKKDILTKQIDEWLRDFELATDDYGEADNSTFDGSAYILLSNANNYLKQINEKR